MFWSEIQKFIKGSQKCNRYRSTQSLLTSLEYIQSRYSATGCTKNFQITSL